MRADLTNSNFLNVSSGNELMADPGKPSATVNGFVISLNRRRAVMGINTNKGVSIVEVLDSHEPALGDAVTGPLHSLGCNRLSNVTQATQFDSLIQEIHDDLVRMRNCLDDGPPGELP